MDCCRSDFVTGLGFGFVRAVPPSGQFQSHRTRFDLVRAVPPPSDFQFQGHIIGIPRPHVVFSACGPSSMAWESGDRGIFIAALLDLLKGRQIDKLRHCDIVKRLNIDYRFVRNLFVKSLT